MLMAPMLNATKMAVYLILQVEHALALVTAAKTGLSDSEMLDLLAHDAAFHSQATYGEV
jgi:hypothetical protein